MVHVQRFPLFFVVVLALAIEDIRTTITTTTTRNDGLSNVFPPMCTYGGGLCLANVAWYSSKLESLCEQKDRENSCTNTLGGSCAWDGATCSFVDADAFTAITALPSVSDVVCSDDMDDMFIQKVAFAKTVCGASTEEACENETELADPCNTTNTGSATNGHGQATAHTGPDWDDFKMHTTAVVLTWTFVTMIGILLASCRGAWDTERVEKWLRKPKNVVTTNKYYLRSMGGVALTTTLVSMLQSSNMSYPSLLDAISLYGGYVHVVEILVVWLYAVARSSEEIASMCFGRLFVDAAVVATGLLAENVNDPEDRFSFSYVASIRVVMIWEWYHAAVEKSATMQLYTTLMKLASAIYTIASVINQTETLAGEQWQITWDTNPPIMTGLGAPAKYRWTMSAAAYFVLSTITTVGFGDYYPKSVIGQVSVVFIACYGLFQLSRAVLGILQALDTGMRGGGSYGTRRRAKHIVVCGGFNFLMLKVFLEEIYHEDHAQEAEDLNTVILFLPGQRHVRAQAKLFLRQNRHLLHRVWLLEGSALKQEDLNRVSYHDASMAFVLPNLNVADPQREDLENVMRALSMQTHTMYVRIVPMLLRAEHLPLMVSAGVARKDIICMDELKLGLLGKSCDARGFVTLVSTLVKNMGVANMAKVGFDDPWTEHYLHGIANEFYEQNLSAAYNGVPFVFVALDILERSNGTAYLVGLVEDPVFPGDETITQLFPGRYFRVGTNTNDRITKGVFIAQEREDIKQHKPDTPFKWSAGGATSARALQEAEKAANSLPNAVPEEQLQDAGAPSQSRQLMTHGRVHYEYFNTPGRQGWIRDPWHVAEEHDRLVKNSMEDAVTRRVAQTLTFRGMTNTDVEKLIGKPVKQVKAEDALRAEDEAEDAGAGGDHTRAALLKQHVEVQQQAQDEAALLADKERLRAESKLKALAKKCVVAAEKNFKDDSTHTEDLNAREREDDDALWGGPVPPPPVPWGNPREPPTHILQRGDHVVLLLLENTAVTEGEIGGKRGLHHFVRALRASDSLIPRPVVVVAARPPLDWPETAREGGMYLVIGNPISAQNLKRCALRTCHAVVIHQDARVISGDLNTSDAEAIFACKVVDAILSEENRDVSVILELVLQENAIFVPMCKHERKNIIQIMEAEMKEIEASKDLDEDDKKKLAAKEQQHVPFHMENKYIIGQLFTPTLMISMCANMLYNPALGALVREMVHAKVVIVPIPEEFTGRSYRQLFEFLLRRKNLLIVALLRKQDEHCDAIVFEEEMDEEDEGKVVTGGEGTKAERWTKNEPAWQRFVFTMPEGNRAVADHDGCLCLLPNKRFIGGIENKSATVQ